MRAAKEFNLTLANFGSEVDDDIGIWDGSQFVVTVGYIFELLSRLQY